jgi:hypothetical protein
MVATTPAPMVDGDPSGATSSLISSAWVPLLLVAAILAAAVAASRRASGRLGNIPVPRTSSRIPIFGHVIVLPPPPPPPPPQCAP